MAAQLQSKCENLKTDVRKTVANEKTSYARTGGGPSTTKYDPIIWLVLDIINKKTVLGLPSQFDSDASQFDNQCDTSLHSTSKGREYVVCILLF